MSNFRTLSPEVIQSRKDNVEKVRAVAKKNPNATKQDIISKSGLDQKDAERALDTLLQEKSLVKTGTLKTPGAKGAGKGQYALV